MFVAVLVDEVPVPSAGDRASRSSVGSAPLVATARTGHDAEHPPAARAPANRRWRVGGAAARAAAYVSVLVVVAIVLATRHGSTSGTSPQPVITVAGAEQVLVDLWPKREAARTSDDVRALGEVDSGAELRRDLSVTLDARDAGSWSERVIRPLGAKMIAVSDPAGYPASFIAAVQTTNQFSSGPSSHKPEGIDTTLLVFVKPSKTAHWSVALETGYSGTLEELSPEENESGRPRVRPSRHGVAPEWLKPAGAISALANYYQHYADYGGAPHHTPFLPGTWTTHLGKEIAGGNSRGGVNRLGFFAHVTYTPATGSANVYHFMLGGYEVDCGTVELASTSLPVRGGFLYQPRTRDNWGGWLPPGAYSAIRASGEHQVCLAVEGFNGIEVIGGESEDATLSESGTPLLLRRPAPLQRSQRS